MNQVYQAFCKSGLIVETYATSEKRFRRKIKTHLNKLGEVIETVEGIGVYKVGNVRNRAKWEAFLRSV
jgi:TnpA family transposase